MLLIQHIAGPKRSHRSLGIEVPQVDEPRHGFVMVAAHEDFSQLLGAFDDLFGAGSVAHDIPQVHHKVVARGGGQACFQRLQIAVDIA